MLMTILLIGRTSLPVRCHGLSSLFASLTKTAGCVAKIPILELINSLALLCALCTKSEAQALYILPLPHSFLKLPGVGVISLPIG
jgi:hypothetical protein